MLNPNPDHDRQAAQSEVFEALQHLEAVQENGTHVEILEAQSMFTALTENYIQTFSHASSL